MATIGREAARAPLTSADINDGIVGAQDLQATLDLSSKAVTLPALQSLTVSAAVPSIQMTDTDNNADAYIQATDGNLRFYADDSAEAAGSLITFNIDGGEKARIDESGNVGLGNGAYIGTLSSTHSLSIQGGAGAPGGKITLYGGTGSNRIDFLIGASEAMRLDASGNLLVGTTGTSSAVAGTVIYGDSLAGVITHTYAGRPLYINRLSTDGDIIELAKDGTTVGSIQSRAGLVSTIILDPRSGSLGTGITGSGANLSPTNGSGTEVDARNDLGTATYRFKDLYLSGGVYLGGTGAANHLDDYEEGTWTLTVSGVSGLTVKSAKYVKIGRAVHIDVRATWTSAGGTGNLSFSLPFPTPSSPEPAQTGIVFYSGTALRSGTPLSTHIGQSNTAVTFYITSGGNFSNIKSNEVNGSYDWLFSLTYFTDA